MPTGAGGTSGPGEPRDVRPPAAPSGDARTGFTSTSTLGAHAYAPLTGRGVSVSGESPAEETGRALSASGAPASSSVGGEMLIERASRISELVTKTSLGTAHKGGLFWAVESKSFDKKEPLEEVIQEAIKQTFSGIDVADLDVTGFRLDLPNEVLTLNYTEEGLKKTKTIDLKKVIKELQSGDADSKEVAKKLSGNLDKIREDAKVKLKGMGVNFDPFSEGSYAPIHVGKNFSLESRIKEKGFKSFVAQLQNTLGLSDLEPNRQTFKAIRTKIKESASKKLDDCKKLRLIHEATLASASLTPEQEKDAKEELAKLNHKEQELNKLLSTLEGRDVFGRGQDLRGQDVDLACAIAKGIYEKTPSSTPADEVYKTMASSKKEEKKREVVEKVSQVIQDHKIKGVWNSIATGLNVIGTGIKSVGQKIGLVAKPSPEDAEEAGKVGFESLKKASKQFGTEVAGLLYRLEGGDAKDQEPARVKYKKLCEEFETHLGSEGLADALLIADKVSGDAEQFDAVTQFLGIDIKSADKFPPPPPSTSGGSTSP